MKLPEAQHSTAALIFKSYEDRRERGGRPHLGASELGHACDRYLWQSFRWMKEATFNGRMLRLFLTGHLEEIRIVADLKAIGCEVWEKDENGKQFSYAFASGHGGGSMDGVATGIPEAPKTPHLLEFKTSNDKGFAATVKAGVEKAKPMHYIQMQVYMHLAGLERALYMMVNKNTDDIHAERIHYNKRIAEDSLSRAARIVTANEPPAKCSDDPAWFECGWCRFKPICHGTETPQVNCRTCIHSTAELDGVQRWSCAWHKKDLSVPEQRAGCEHHRHMPAMLARFAEVVDADLNGNVVYKHKDTGNEFSQPAYTSQEITDCEQKQLLGDGGIDDLKQMGGKIVPTTEAGEQAHPSPAFLSDLKDDLPWTDKTITSVKKKKWQKKAPAETTNLWQA